jgi:hypothetical protein
MRLFLIFTITCALGYAAYYYGYLREETMCAQIFVGVDSTVNTAKFGKLLMASGQTAQLGDYKEAFVLKGTRYFVVEVYDSHDGDNIGTELAKVKEFKSVSCELPSNIRKDSAPVK